MRRLKYSEMIRFKRIFEQADGGNAKLHINSNDVIIFHQILLIAAIVPSAKKTQQLLSMVAGSYEHIGD